MPREPGHALRRPTACSPSSRRPRRWSTAARRAREAGYTQIDAYSPFPIEELTEALMLPRNRVPLVVLLGGLIGGLARLRPAVLDVRDRTTRSTSAAGRSTVARVHLRDVRDDDPGCRAGRRARHARAERAADAVPPAVQRAAVRGRLERWFFLCIEAADPKFDARVTRSSSKSFIRWECPTLQLRRAGAGRCGAGTSVPAVASERSRVLRGCCSHACCRWRRVRPAGRTCTTSRRSRPTARPTSSPIAGACGRFPRTPSRVAFLQRGRSPVHGQGERAVHRRVPVPGDAGGAAARARPLRDLSARPATDRRERAMAWSSSAAYRPPPSFHTEQIRNADGRLLVRRDDQRLRRHARLPRAGGSGGPLGDCGVHPGAAIEPARHDGRRPADKVSELNAPQRPATAPAVGDSGGAQGGVH